MLIPERYSLVLHQASQVGRQIPWRRKHSVSHKNGDHRLFRQEGVADFGPHEVVWVVDATPAVWKLRVEPLGSDDDDHDVAGAGGLL